MPVLKYAQVPLQLLLRVCTLLVLRVGRVRGCRLQRFVLGANPVGHITLALAEALKPVENLRALAGQFLERAGQRKQQFRFGFGATLASEIRDRRFSLVDRHAPARHLADKRDNFGSAAPGFGFHVDLGASPNRTKRKSRHLDLLARPIRVGLGAHLRERDARSEEQRDNSKSASGAMRERFHMCVTLWLRALRFKPLHRCDPLAAFFAALVGVSIAPSYAASTPPRAAVFNFELLDTSLDGQTQGTKPEEIARVDHLAPHLRDALAASGRYTITPTDAVDARAHAQNLQACGGCDVTLAREIGAEVSITGQVQKVSNLILNMNIYVRDVATGRLISLASADMRGNTEESWTRTLNWLIRNRLLAEQVQ